MYAYKDRGGFAYTENPKHCVWCNKNKESTGKRTFYRPGNKPNECIKELRVCNECKGLIQKNINFHG